MKDEGFTLLEILVVTIVFGLLCVALWQGIGVGTRGWFMAERRYSADVAGEGIEDALRRLLERAEVPDNANTPTLSGQVDRLRVVSWLPEKEGYAHEVEAALGVNAQHELVLRWHPYRRADCPNEAEVPHEEVLAQGVRDLEFSYYGLSGGRHTWQSAWNSPHLPLLVRVHVGFVAAGKNWPTIMIRPLLSGAESG
ncbi:prepilin-type N-terminal cleavage/methylation domain-containing protein [Acetobacter estunensis]|uniref:prepilin-type N-terminal cleavage/methylation domain-containing protein n=1 Tax=Acetobacter estunensis TaxID=104097 RepID=UPI001C2DB34B|nr:prepilin-type N-terminal cleavage/methylation domain-containing protein [Acetobacter estunensis]MBV1836747.1 prepilin-type N-terminal cleavage/methylation domain-containing protein [Acetobacter estunensis]